MLGQETEKSLSSIENIEVNNIEWTIRYNVKLRIIYELHNIIAQGLKECDSLHFIFRSDGKLRGRIFKMN